MQGALCNGFGCAHSQVSIAVPSDWAIYEVNIIFFVFLALDTRAAGLRAGRRNKRERRMRVLVKLTYLANLIRRTKECYPVSTRVYCMLYYCIYHYWLCAGLEYYKYTCMMQRTEVYVLVGTG